MLPDRVSNPGPLTYESGALPIALRGPAFFLCYSFEKWFDLILTAICACLDHDIITSICISYK